MILNAIGGGHAAEGHTNERAVKTRALNQAAGKCGKRRSRAETKIEEERWAGKMDGVDLGRTHAGRGDEPIKPEKRA